MMLGPRESESIIKTFFFSYESLCHCEFGGNQGSCIPTESVTQIQKDRET